MHLPTLALSLGLVLLAVPGVARAQDDESQSHMDSVAAQQARAAGVAYQPTIREAKNLDPKALHALLQVSVAMDGAGAEVHSEVLWDLLQRWGDSAFARQLTAEPLQVRDRVTCYLRMAACDPRTSEWYPVTFALEPASKRCECFD